MNVKFGGAPGNRRTALDGSGDFVKSADIEARASMTAFHGQGAKARAKRQKNPQPIDCGFFNASGSPGRIRTYNLSVNSRVLCR